MANLRNGKANAWRSQIRRLGDRLANYGVLGNEDQVKDMVRNSVELGIVSDEVSNMLLDAFKGESKVTTVPIKMVRDMIQMTIVLIAAPGMYPAVESYFVQYAAKEKAKAKVLKAAEKAAKKEG
jgi:hypothetical protein